MTEPKEHDPKEQDDSVIQAARRFVEALERERSWQMTPDRSSPDLGPWCARNAARVELLIALAADAIEECDPDLVLPLLQAASMALGNVDSRLLPENAFERGPVEVRLCTQLRQTACAIVRRLGTRGEYEDYLVFSRVDDFVKVIRRLDDKVAMEVLEGWERSLSNEGR